MSNGIDSKIEIPRPLKRSQLRLIRLLTLLRALQQGIQGEKLLCKRFGISRATLYRDLQLLRHTGFPIAKQPEGFSLKTFELSPEEERVAQLALSALHGLTQVPYGRALQALVTRFDVSRARVRILDNPITRMTPNQREHFRQLEELIVHGKGCWISYQPPGGKVSHLKIFPRYLLFKRRAWYVLALVERKGEHAPQLFRLNRVQNLQPTKAQGPYWSGDVQDYFANAWEFRGGELPKRVVLRLLSDRARDLIDEVQWHPTQRVVKRKNQWIFQVHVADPEEMIPWILQFGPGVQVIEPRSLCRKIKLEVDALLHLYKSQSR